MGLLKSYLIYCCSFIVGMAIFTFLLFQRVLPTDTRVILQREESNSDWHMPKASPALWEAALCLPLPSQPL